MMPNRASQRWMRVPLVAIVIASIGCSPLFERDEIISAARFNGPSSSVSGPDTVQINTLATFSVTSFPCGRARADDVIENSVGEIVVRARTRGEECSPDLARFYSFHSVEAQWKIPGMYDVRFIGECGGVECYRNKLVVVVPAA